MKALSVLNLSAVASVCLGMAFGSANDRAVGQCIRLHPEGGLDPAKPYASAVQAHTHEALTGAGGHVLGYVDQEDAGLDPNPKQLLILPTTSGRYVLRIRDLPSGLGLHGPFW
jgi:hypothetical protein